jgi:subtilisin family serine protease
VCDFTVKMRNVLETGAIGVIVANRDPAEAPFTMGHNGIGDLPSILSVMVSTADGTTLKAHDGGEVVFLSQASYVEHAADANRMADFSSQGPTQQDLLVKPDVVAPGADVLSSFPAAYCAQPPCWAIIGGTSMATPHLAGAAAVVRGLHPSWDAAAVRSAIVNTATGGVLRDSASNAVTSDALIVGAGLLDLGAAATAPLALDPVSTSFANASSGGGKAMTKTINVTNVGTSSVSLTATVNGDAPGDGVTFSTSTSTLSIAPGASGAISVSVAPAKGAADGPRQAVLSLVAGGREVAHTVLFVFVGEGDRAPGPHLGNRNKD